MPKGDERYVALKQILKGRQGEITIEIRSRIRDTTGNQPSLVEVDETEAAIQDDIEFALVQMKAETLNRIVEALARLEAGNYGYCFACQEEIAVPRLRALPFALRCKSCEEKRELEQQKERLASRGGRVHQLFGDK